MQEMNHLFNRKQVEYSKAIGSTLLPQFLPLYIRRADACTVTGTCAYLAVVDISKSSIIIYSSSLCVLVGFLLVNIARCVSVCDW